MFSSVSTKNKSSAKYRHYFPVVTVLIINIIALTLLWQEINQREQNTIKAEFQLETQRITTKINERMTAYGQLLRSGSAFFSSSQQITRDEWKLFVSKLDIDQGYRGLQGLGFSLLIPQEKLEAHINQIRQEGFTDYLVTPEGPRETYTSIIYLEPFTGRNLRAFGFDMFSEPVRHDAMSRARDIGDLAFSGKVKLLQETKQDVQAGILGYFPVYKNHVMTQTVDQRRSALIGWVYSPFRMNDLMKSILDNEANTVQLKIYDGLEITDESLLFDSHNIPNRLNNEDQQLSKTIEVGGRYWNLQYTILPGFIEATHINSKWLDFTGLIAISLLLTAFTWVQSNTRRKAELIAHTLTASLQQSEARYNCIFSDSKAPMLIISPSTGQILEANHSAADYYGYSKDQLQNRNISDINTFTIDQISAEIKLASLENRSGLYFQHRLANGEIRDVEVHMGPINVNNQNLILEIIHDITIRKQAEAMLKASSLHARSLIEASLDTLITINVDGKITDVNKATELVTGRNREELIDSDFSNYFTEPEHARLGYQTAFEQGSVTDYHLAIRHISGHITEVLFNASLYRDTTGHVIGVFAAARDVTQIKRTEAELAAYRNHLEELVAEQTENLRNAKEIAEDANRTKSKFLANMSHEIRTPMNGVVGMIDIIKKTHLNSAQKRMLNTIQNSSIALLTILDDILDFSKIEAGKMNVELIPVNLQELIESIAELIAPKAAEKNINLMLFISPNMPIFGITDPVRLRQILLNLLGNAVKFTHNEGQVELRVSTTIVGPSEMMIELHIVDNGIGMSAEQVSQVFQPFLQGDLSTTRRFGGTGLGLSISKHLIELLGGKIQIFSQPNIGSEFIVTLPIDIDAHSKPICLPSLNGIDIYAVINHSGYEEILSTYLDSVGAKVHFIETFNEAILQIYKTHQSNSDNVLLCLNQAPLSPSNDDLLKTLNTPLIVLKPRQTITNDANQFFVAINPMLIEDLVFSIAIATQRVSAKERADHSDTRNHPRTLAPTIEAAEISGQLMLIAEDNWVNREVLKEQLKLLGYACESAEDGIEALKLWRSGRFGLLLSDCHMPNMDGFQLAQSIRSEASTDKHFPIIAITANAMPEEKQRCLDCGIDDYLSKPVRLDKLAAAVAKWLPPAEITATQETVPSSILFDPYHLFHAVGDKPQFHQRMLKLFLTQAAQQLENLRSNLDNPLLIATEAHKFKGAARNVGAIKLGDICQQLEIATKSPETATVSSLIEELTATFKETARLINEHLA